jgi:probable HAF family extracellular repeat protein
MAGDVEDIATAAVARIEGGELQIDPLGVLPGFNWSDADAISSDGTWVAGTCRREGPWQAFRWSAATGMQDLGSLADRNSWAYDVNNAGQVVGMSDLEYGGRYSQAAVLWENGLVFDLNALTDAGNKIHLPLAKGINDAGHIVGIMDISRPVSEQHGFLLIPNTQ